MWVPASAGTRRAEARRHIWNPGGENCTSGESCRLARRHSYGETVTRRTNAGKNVLFSVLYGNSARSQTPGGRSLTIRLKPEFTNCGPKAAPTSGREPPYVGTPTNR